MQACVTRWFKPMDPSKVDQYHNWLFEKEKADREKRAAEREARIKAERNRLRQIQREKEQKRKEAERLRREEEARKREEWARRKFEGQPVVPGIFLGGRLAAQNAEWLLEAINDHKLTTVINCTPNVKNYFDAKDADILDLQTDDIPTQELEELASILEQCSEPATSISKSEMTSGESSGAAVSDWKQSQSASIQMECDQVNILDDDTGHVSSSQAEPEDEDALFKRLETLDDDAKLALLETIQLPNDEEELLADIKLEESEEPKIVSTTEILERHRSRMARQKGSIPGLNLIYRRIPIEDDGRVDITDHFRDTCAVIRETLARGESVFVHCREGRSRSVTIVLAFLIQEQKKTLAEAMDAVHQAIKDENVNVGFKQQLMNLELQIHGCHSIDYSARRNRRATINASYTDNISEITGERSRKSKRIRGTSKLAGALKDAENDNQETASVNVAEIDNDNDDEDYVGEENEAKPPPSKIRATRSKSTNTVSSISACRVDIINTTAQIIYATDTAMIVDMIGDAAVAEIPSSTLQMEVDTPRETEKEASKKNVAILAQSPAITSEKQTKSKGGTKQTPPPASTPAKNATKKKTTHVTHQSNTLLNYFTKAAAPASSNSGGN